MRPLVLKAGATYGMWTVISKAPNVNGRTRYKCICQCGTVRERMASELYRNKRQSCGCARLAAVTTHGMHATKTYTVWADMLQRCGNPNNASFDSYGGRGITVCKRWLKFENFIADMGEVPPRLSLERKNNGLGYCKRNCYWATRKQQANNTRAIIRLTFKGNTKTLSEWSDITGIGLITLRGRIRNYGWSVKKTLTTPVEHRNLVHPRWRRA